jgi:hypothetical protein
VLQSLSPTVGILDTIAMMSTSVMLARMDPTIVGTPSGASQSLIKKRITATKAVIMAALNNKPPCDAVFVEGCIQFPFGDICIPLPDDPAIATLKTMPLLHGP